MNGEDDKLILLATFRGLNFETIDFFTVNTLCGS
jgi:hypothetical protein